MFYSWAYLGKFGINVFNYAHVGDFLLASLKEPFTWGLVLIAVAAVVADNAMSRRVQRRSPRRWIAWYGSPKYRLTNNFVVIFMILLFIYAYAIGQAKDTHEGKGDMVNVEYSNDKLSRSVMLLGTTAQWVFLFDIDANRVDVHPIESIHSISFQAD